MQKADKASEGSKVIDRAVKQQKKYPLLFIKSGFK